MGLTATRVADLAALPRVLPLAAKRGGYLCGRVDSLGFICEAHALFEPAGRGHEAHEAGILALEAVWRLGFQMVTTTEVQGLGSSRPPLSFGFRPAGSWRETPLGLLRLWSVSQDAWIVSPAFRRYQSCHP